MMNNGRIRQSFSSKDLTSNEGSEYGGPIEFTREDVEALLHERIKYKSKYNYKVLFTFFLSFLFLSLFLHPDLLIFNVFVWMSDFRDLSVHAIYLRKSIKDSDFVD